MKMLEPMCCDAAMPVMSERRCWNRSSFMVEVTLCDAANDCDAAHPTTTSCCERRDQLCDSQQLSGERCHRFRKQLVLRWEEARGTAGAAAGGGIFPSSACAELQLPRGLCCEPRICERAGCRRCCDRPGALQRAAKQQFAAGFFMRISPVFSVFEVRGERDDGEQILGVHRAAIARSILLILLEQFTFNSEGGVKPLILK